MVKAKQKKPKNTSKQSSKWSNKRILVLLLCALLAYLFIAILFFKTSQYLDAKKFSNAERTQKQITNEIVNKLGDLVTSVQTKNVCFITEQGPYDNGTLWCQTASVVNLKSRIEYQNIIEPVINFANQEKILYQKSDALFVTTKSGVKCSIISKDPNGDSTGSSTRDPLLNIKGPVVSVSCADRAKAKHYPYSP